MLVFRRRGISVKKNIVSVFFILPFISVFAQAQTFKLIGVGQDYEEPLYSGEAILIGQYSRNYEDYTVMGIENPVCFNLSLKQLKAAPSPVSANFCFKNSREAHKILNLPINGKKGCLYEGNAKIKIKNFSLYSSIDPSVLDITYLVSASEVSKPKITCD